MIKRVGDRLTRRRFLGAVGAAAGASSVIRPVSSRASTEPEASGNQRLSLTQLHAWEALGYGMFLHFGLSTFTGQEWADGKAPPPFITQTNSTPTSGSKWRATRV